MNNIIKTFQKYDIIIDEEKEKKFLSFFDDLVETNKVMNLTSITDFEDVLFKHFLDSVLPINSFSKNAKIVDVGSGAGFPAIPLKIVRDDLNITMIDSLQKRVNFLNNTINNLQLENITAVHSRAEDFAKDFRESFDISTARAVAPLNTLLEYLLPLTKVGGCAIIFKSTKLDEELESAKNALNILGAKIKEIKHYEIKEQNLVRNVLILEKFRATPKQYPRAKNLPKTKPL